MSNPESPASTGPRRCGIASAVAASVLERADVGLAKYGVTLERTDLSQRDWLKHAFEEALDLACYLRRMMEEEDQKSDALRSILDWTRAYPVEAFPEPNLEKVREAIGDAELSKLHASWARHLLSGIEQYARNGLGEEAQVG